MSRFQGLLPRASLALLVLVAWGFLPAAQAATPVPAPLGLDVDGTSYALISNALWNVTDASGTQTQARQVVLLKPKRANATTAYDRQDKADIWARTCTDARQQLSFRRKLFMPGRPKTFGAQFDPTFYGSIGGVTVFINGNQALAFANGYIRVAEDASETVRLFKFGINDIEVRVTKRAKSASQGFCRSGNPSKPLGLYFNLYGKYEADTAVSQVATGSGGYYHVYMKTTGDAPSGLINVNTRYRAMPNRGPSGAYRSTLIVILNSGPSTTSLDVGELAFLGGQIIRNCAQTSLHVRHWQLKCEVERWPAGTLPGVVFKAHIGFPTDPDAQKIFDLYGEAHLYPKTSDPLIGNNDDYFQITICRPGATNPKCPK